MRRRLFGLITALLFGSGCAGGPVPPHQPVADTPQMFKGKVIPLAAQAGESDGSGLALAADDGTTYPLLKDEGSAMLFEDSRFHNCPLRLTALRVSGGNDLRVVLVQMVKDGKVYDVDYWCGVCQISI